MSEVQAPFRFTVTYGDITMFQMPNGAIVNPSNTGMILNSGVSEQIARRAGPFFQQKLHTARSGLPNNRLEMGRTIDTEAGQLNVKRLLHVSIIGKKKVDKRLITSCILNVYDRAEDMELEELAWPALGVGVGKFPVADFIELFFQITLEELPRSESLKHVVLCLYDENEFAVAQEYIAKHADDVPEDVELEVTEGKTWALG